MPIDGWTINRPGSSHTVDYYSAMNRNEALAHATMWMNPENMMLNPENVMLSERSQTQNTTHCLILHLHEIPRTVNPE